MSKAPPGQVRQTKQEWMRAELPYGLWKCEDGRQVLFNRWYKPIWRKLPDGRVEAANPSEWIDHTEEEWFYKDGNPPWSSKASLKLCEGKMIKWGIPAPDPTAARYKPRGTLGLYRGAA